MVFLSKEYELIMQGLEQDSEQDSEQDLKQDSCLLVHIKHYCLCMIDD